MYSFTKINSNSREIKNHKGYRFLKVFFLFMTFFFSTIESIHAQTLGEILIEKWLNNAIIWISVFIILFSIYTILKAQKIINQYGSIEGMEFSIFRCLSKNKTVTTIIYFLIIIATIIWALKYKVAN